MYLVYSLNRVRARMEPVQFGMVSRENVELVWMVSRERLDNIVQMSLTWVLHRWSTVRWH